MNNLLSYCWLVDAKIRASDKDLLVSICVFYFSSVSKEGSVGPRTGFFHHFAQREIIAKRFDPKEEVFVSDVSNEDIERFRLDLQNLDKNLGKYIQTLKIIQRHDFFEI